MIAYQESGLVITLPEDEHFRFHDCQAYQLLSGQHLKEMDFGWWQADKKVLWLIEIKEYESLTPTERLPAHLLNNLVNKATDSLLMLAALWAKTNKGLELAKCLPSSIHQFPGRVKLFFIFKVAEDQTLFRNHFGSLKDALKNQLRGKRALFDIKHITLVDHLTAIKCNLPITIPNTND